MKRWSILLALVLVALSPSHARTQSVPGLISFTARLLDEGAPVEGEHTFIFRLFDAESGGNQVWTELQSNVNVEGGMVFLSLGEVTPLDAAILGGSARWLEVTVDAVALEPRLPLLSAPYAVRAGTAGFAEALAPAALGGSGTASTAAHSDHLHDGQYLPAAAGSCPGGQYVSGINANGTLQCSSLDSAIRTYVNQNCFIYYGWRDSCNGCTDAPSKFGRVNGNTTCNLTAGESNCVQPTLNGVVVNMFQINFDGDVNNDDSVYVGLKCF